MFDCSNAPQEFKWKKLQQTHYRAATLLRRVIELVTPRESVPLESLRMACTNIFQLEVPNSDSITKKTSSSSFTTSDVKFERLERVLSPLEAKERKTLDPKFVWYLSRQPLARNSSHLHFQIYPNRRHLQTNLMRDQDKISYCQDISPYRSPYKTKECEDRWSPWTL